uniref:(California timema) hypothetical protein n=1 Tax=Timema californicum TaxID=61474 RepID=A0A7R9IW99_TIMCA|nr:unnamed protein product [Timema californicum]
MYLMQRERPKRLPISTETTSLETPCFSSHPLLNQLWAAIGPRARHTQTYTLDSQAHSLAHSLDTLALTLITPPTPGHASPDTPNTENPIQDATAVQVFSGVGDGLRFNPYDDLFETLTRIPLGSRCREKEGKCLRCNLLESQTKHGALFSVSLNFNGNCSYPSQRATRPKWQAHLTLSTGDEEHRVLLPVRIIRLSNNYSSGLGIGKVEFRGSDPAFAWSEDGKPFRENHASSPDRDFNLDLPALGSLAQHEASALANYATKTGFFHMPRSTWGSTVILHLQRKLCYSSPMASFVLTDSSQLTSDSQHLGLAYNERHWIEREQDKGEGVMGGGGKARMWDSRLPQLHVSHTWSPFVYASLKHAAITCRLAMVSESRIPFTGGIVHPMFLVPPAGIGRYVTDRPAAVLRAAPVFVALFAPADKQTVPGMWPLVGMLPLFSQPSCRPDGRPARRS